MGVVEQKSFCRVCGSACGIIVETDGEQVVRVRADEEHAITAGYTCPKGRNLPQDHHREDRLEVPMIREDGVLRPTSWDHVLDDLGAKLKRIIDESGPSGVGLFTGGGGYLDASGHLSWQAFKNGIATPSVYSDLTIDSVAKLVVSELVTGFPGLMSRADIERCKLVIFMGTNPVISHGHTWTLSSPTASLRAMRQRGTEVWVIDPRKTETAQRADRYLASRPSTDYAILGYLIRELLIEGADRAFIEQHAQGAEKLQAAVERFTLSHASALSGVAEADLRDLLASVRKAGGSVAVDTGTGITMSRPGNVTQWLSWCLMIITGSMDREGGSWFSPGNIVGMDKMDVPPAPETGWGLPGPQSRPEMKAVGGEFPCAAMPDEIAAGNLRAMVVFGGNIEVCLPQTTRSYEALKKLEVMATFDVRPTRTTDASTHILPTKDQLERADMTYVTDMYFPVISTQYTPAMVEPVGDRKAYWWVLGQLGKRMGVDFFPGLDVDTATDDTVMAYITRDSELDFEQLRSARHVSRPPVFGWVQRYVDEKIGGWRLAPSPLLEQLEGLGALEGAEPAAFTLIPRRQRYHENSKMLDLRDKPYVYLNEADAQTVGVAEGAKVRVSNANGSVERFVKIDDTLRRGAINVPHGWSDEINVNRLTGTQDVDSISGMVRYSGLPVSLEAV
ncbi:MAG: molybdopterin-dependent oxidoreductase [Novosphingobium sp.]|nr:molybdopterin-dependent oxidoreductase [Novosphingobium sp.]